MSAFAERVLANVREEIRAEVAYALELAGEPEELGHMASREPAPAVSGVLEGREAVAQGYVAMLEALQAIEAAALRGNGPIARQHDEHTLRAVGLLAELVLRDVTGPLALERSRSERRPDPTDLFEALEAALVEGTPTISLQQGRIWIDDAVFDAGEVLDALEATRASSPAPAAKESSCEANND